MQYALVAAKFNSKKYHRLLDEAKQIEPPPLANIGERVLFSRGVKTYHMARAWASLGVSQRVEAWSSAIMSIMLRKPEFALKALRATFIPPYPPGRRIADVLEFLVHYHIPRGKAVEEEKLSAILGFVNRLLRHHRKPRLGQHAIRLLTLHAGPGRGEQLYRLMGSRDIEIHPRTAFHLVTILARQLSVPAARHMLRRLVRWQTPVNTPLFRRTCTTLLKEAGNKLYGRQAVIVLNEMLAYGLTPNLIIYNVAILNALRMGDDATAWRIYGVLKEEGFRPDVHTFSTLITGAKRREDWAAVDMAMDELRAFEVQPDLWLATDILHTTYFYMHKTQRRSSLPDLIKVYETFFSPSLLRQFGIMPPADDADKLAPVKPEPLPATINALLWAYVMYCPDWTVLAEMWARYRTMAASAASSASLLTRSAHIPTAFILAFARSPLTLLYCPTIVGDMLAADSGLPRPSLQTWNVLLYAYVRNSQMHAAEKVLQLMRQHGVEPDRVTWNSLVSGYAAQDDVGGVVDALQRMQQAGIAADGRTARALMRVRSRDALAVTLMRAEQESSAQRRAREMEKFVRRKRRTVRRRMMLLMRAQASGAGQRQRQLYGDEDEGTVGDGGAGGREALLWRKDMVERMGLDDVDDIRIRQRQQLIQRDVVL